MSQQVVDEARTPLDVRQLAGHAVQVVRWSLVAVLVATVVALVALQPRAADYNVLAEAVERDDVVAFTVTKNPTWLEPGPALGDDESVVVWRDRSGSSHVTELSTADAAVADLKNNPSTSGLDDTTGDRTDPSADRGSGAFARLAADRNMARLDLAATSAARLAPILDALWVLAILLVITGVQPRRATKWAWVWISLTSLGLGLLWWLLAEHPWSRRARAQAEPLPHARQRQEPGGDSRVTGGFGFVLMLAASMAVWLAFPSLGH